MLLGALPATPKVYRAVMLTVTTGLQQPAFGAAAIVTDQGVRLCGHNPMC
jgi:hypothetical protein